MTLGHLTLGAAYSLAETTDAGVPSALTAVWDAEFGVVFLYELTTYKRGTAGAWIIPLATYALGEFPAEAAVTGEQIFRYSDAGFTSGPTDSVANTPYEGIIDTGLRITRTTPGTPEAPRRVNLDLGAFALNNQDGELDSVVKSYAVDGRRIRILLGLETYRYDDFIPIFTGRIVQWSNSLSRVAVAIRDESYYLDRNLQADIYDGTGGYNGGADLQGKPRPVCFGIKRNVAPPMIDSTNLVYQFHSRTAQAVDAVYDKGAALVADADYATYALLNAAVITTGHYATCLAFGLIRLGSTPSGLVTADVRGDASGSYVDTTGDVAKRMLKDFGGLVDANLDLSSISTFTAAVTGSIGWYRGPEAISTADAVSQVIGHCSGWWGAQYDGTIQFGRLAAPTSDSYTLGISADDCINFEILDPVAGTFPPRYRQRVSYQTLGTVQQETDLAGAVTAARRSYLAQESRVTYAQDTSVQSDFLLATDPEPLASLFDSKTDADTLAALLLALYKAFRQTVRVTMDLKGLTARLSSTVLVTHPRLNSGADTPMLLIDVTLVADKRQVELVLWG